MTNPLQASLCHVRSKTWSMPNLQGLLLQSGLEHAAYALSAGDGEACRAHYELEGGTGSRHLSKPVTQLTSPAQSHPTTPQALGMGRLAELSAIWG